MSKARTEVTCHYSNSQGGDNMGKKNKKEKLEEEATLFYETIGDTISPGVAYNQAASLLDLAAVSAVDSQDIVGMVEIAHKWMEMAVLMGNKENESPDDITSKTKIMGFGTTEYREVVEKDARQS